MNAPITAATGFTAQIVDRALALRFDDLPDDVVELARHSMIDFFACAITGVGERPVQLLIEEADEQGSRPQSAIIGSGQRVSPFWSSWINGAAAHVRVYDDVNMTIPGHGTATAMPAAVAWAEHSRASGRDLIEAYVAGYETSCAIAAVIAPVHYDMGFHASATVGSFGATVAAGRLMKLDAGQMRHALGIAAAMAAGIKGVFGSMTKCIQVGRTGATGILAASLAKRGVTSGEDIIEHPQGFIGTHVPGDFEVSLRLPEAGNYFIRRNLFKHHAACYMAFASIECGVLARKTAGFDAENVEDVSIFVNPAAAKVCNLQVPTTSLEAQYSIRTLTSMAMAGVDTAKTSLMRPIADANPSVVALHARSAVKFDTDLRDTESRISVRMKSGKEVEYRIDVGEPEPDLGLQRERLESKFKAFTEPVLGPTSASKLLSAINDIDRLKSIDGLLSGSVPGS